MSTWRLKHAETSPSLGRDLPETMPIFADHSCRQIAQRISFANFLFFALHALVTLLTSSESDPRIHVHTSFWAFKPLVWVGALIGGSAGVCVFTEFKLPLPTTAHTQHS